MGENQFQGDIAMQLNNLKYDLYRYFYPGKDDVTISILKKMEIIIFTQGIWAIIIYRLRRWCSYECKYNIVKMILKPVLRIVQLLVEIASGIHIEPEIDIGPGFYIGHYGQIFLGGNTKIGKFFNISQGCTVGYGGRGDKLGLPEIGDYVYVAPGAKVIGKIKIGNFVAIGANAVVTKDLSDNSVVGGVPAKIINFNSSRDFINFNRRKMGVE